MGLMHEKRKNVKPARVLCFDLDNTLIDGSGSKDAILRTCAQLAAATGLDAARLFEANSRVWQTYWPEVERKWTLGALTGTAVSSEAWRRTLLTCGRNDESLVQLAREVHSRHAREAVRLFDDARELLNIPKSHVPFALITNGASDTQRNTLRILGIEEKFDTVVISGEVGIAKPDPSIFGLALQKLGVEPENAWHVGDSLGTDVAGALDAELVAVWLNRAEVSRNEGDPKPDYEIHSLRELTALLSVQT